ncbi:hypothetical protein T10_5279 [Trichinella papuae]|uniref:Uncharacterized protein n=1 Tax=Trichinella papuae TaxID=268474 RepID=A0A0V1M332_9BILA|nr:hypothetical protein T10_5279 [Trichinella papuae]
MVRTSLCENTVKLYKDKGVFFWENDTGPDLNRPELFKMYGTKVQENGTGLEKKRRCLMWENSRMRLKQGENFLAENFSDLNKKRRSCSGENSSVLNKKRAQLLGDTPPGITKRGGGLSEKQQKSGERKLLGKYSRGNDKEWRSLLRENSGKQKKDDADFYLRKKHTRLNKK